MHEYSILGHKKEKYIYYLTIGSVALSTLISSIISTLNQKFELAIPLTIGASLIFGLFFYIANKFLWKLPFFKIPNLNGNWTCTGKSYKHGSQKTFDWTGTIKISQSWNTIMITLSTDKSTSFSTSIVGGVERIAGSGYKLIYLYKNNPSPGNPELHQHTGLCELLFDETVNNGTGEYFNNKERGSYGSMKLSRSRR